MKVIIPLLFVTLIAEAPAEPQRKGKGGRPNILWIVSDDQRADSIAAFNGILHGREDSALGHVLSPNVDRLAAMGTTFINTFNQNPGCAPSRTLMHTGRYSHRTGVYGFEYYNPTGQAHWRPMAPEILRDKAGYQTLAVGKLGIRAQHFEGQKFGTEPPLYQTNLGYRKEFSAKGLVDWNKESKWVKGKPGPKDETFYFADGTRLRWPENAGTPPDDRAEIRERLDLLRAHLPGDEGDSGEILGGVNPQTGDRTRDGRFAKALLEHFAHADQQYTDMLGRRQQGPDSDKPLFAYIGFEFPHTPVLPPAEFREKFQKLRYEVPAFSKEELAAFPPQLLRLYKNSQSDHFSDEEKQQMIADYYAFCAYGDSLVGETVDGFIQFSEQQNRPWLILYVCGDHGWRLNEHGMVSKFSHYDTDLHNPLIVVSSDKKKFPAGKVVEDFTQFVDMAPTFLAAGGIDISKPDYQYLDGSDLAKSAAGTAPPRDYIIAEPTWVIGPRAVIRTKEYKFAMKTRPRAGHTLTPATAGKDFKWALTADLKDIEPTLFHLRSDPDEIDNLAFDPRYRPVLEALRTKLQNIVLGDGRVEVLWSRTGNDESLHSDFAPGTDDGRLEVPAVTAADTTAAKPHPSEASRSPNIVLVMADDHGYGDCGYTGHPFVQTPHLDAMAKEGVVFDRFYASSPVCSPTRAAVMTGRHAFRVNVPNHGHYLRPHEITIAEVLRDKGYVTGHFGKWHIGSVQPGSPTSPGGQGFDEWLSGLNFFDKDPYLSHNGKYVQKKGMGTTIATDATIDFLTRHSGGDKPMFAVTWFPAPHDPFGEVPEGIENAAALYNDKDKKMAGYFREITLLDQQVGKLRAALRELGIAENTIFLYCSDNGGLVDASAGGRALKGSIYDGGLRVPAILEWPGKFDARRISTPVWSCDILPTMLALAGVDFDPPHPLDGIDVSDIIAGKQKERRPMGFWHGFQNGQSTWSDRIIKSLKDAHDAGKPNPHPDRILKNVEEFPKFERGTYRGHAAWTDWPWKLHRIENGKRVNVELYNLSDDPMETSNLREQHPARVQEMAEALESWQDSVLSSWEGADYK